jgi:radical SAM protein with 4Fe4S-binding SPASM domain
MTPQAQSHEISNSRANTRAHMVHKAFVEFNLMAGCPNSCKYCPQETFLNAYKGVKELAFDSYAAMVDKLPKSCISMSGYSEPFKNPRCADMIKYADKKEHIVIIYTTLQGLDIETYETLRKMYFVRKLTVHLPDKEGNTIIKITDEYKTTLDHIISHPMGGWCHVVFSLHGSAVHPDIQHIVDINPEHRIHDRCGNLKTSDQTVRKVHWQSGKIVCVNNFGQYPETGIVMPNGDVYLCCMDWALAYRLGNLLEQSWSDVMASYVRKRAKKDRETGCHNGICRRCAEAVMDFRR